MINAPIPLNPEGFCPLNLSRPLDGNLRGVGLWAFQINVKLWSNDVVRISVTEETFSNAILWVGCVKSMNTMGVSSFS